MRFIPEGVQVRENTDGTESRTIEGRAINFGQETTLWDGKYYRQREIIEASAITQEFLREQDVKLNALHDRTMSVARNNKGVGTLNLDLRTDGLYFSVDMPKCDIGDRILELIRNKTYTGCSFEFTADQYTEQKSTLPDGREDSLVRHTKLKRLSAISIAMDPAYANTYIKERENYEHRDEELREAAEKAAAKEQEREAKEALARRTRKAELEAIYSLNKD